MPRKKWKHEEEEEDDEEEEEEESSSWSIPTCGAELAGCRAGWNVEPMDKPFLPKQSSERMNLIFL